MSKKGPYIPTQSRKIEDHCKKCGQRLGKSECSWRIRSNFTLALVEDFEVKLQKIIPEISEDKDFQNIKDFLSSLCAVCSDEEYLKPEEVQKEAVNWISVNDRLPVQTEWVLVSSGGSVNCMAYDPVKKRFVDWTEPASPNIRGEVDYWMPIPAPPKSSTIQILDRLQNLLNPDVPGYERVVAVIDELRELEE